MADRFYVSWSRVTVHRPVLPPGPFLYGITDRDIGGDDPGNLASRLFAAGAAVVQIRQRGLADGELLAVVRRAASARSGILIVNDRPDIAVLGGADGVHVGDEDLTPEDVRRLIGPDLLLGVSTHSVAQALAQADKQIDYVAIGPIYPTPIKAHRPAVSLEAIASIKRRTATPVVAIGGITAERVREVVEAGADGVAVVRAAQSNGDVEGLVSKLLLELAPRA